MTVTAVDRRRDADSGQSDSNGRWTYTVPYQVETNNKNDTLPQIVNGAYSFGLPVRGAILAGDPFVRLSRYSGTRAEIGDTSALWNVDAIFEPPPINEREQDRFIHPLARPPRYRIEEEHFTEVAEKDRFGNAILNSAGQPFDEAVEIEKVRVVLVAEKNIARLEDIINANSTFVGKANSNTYRNQPTRTWLVRSIASSELKNEDGVEYYTATYRLAFNPEKWNHVIINRGFKARPAIGQDAEQVTEPLDTDPNERVQVTEPVLLDANGLKTTTPSFKTFEIINQTSFSKIGV